MAKLEAAGIGETYLKFLDAYLEKRYAQVIEEGTASDPFEIHDTVFQGMVLSPPLWNLFFADMVDAAESNSGDASIFADDLNVFKRFDRSSGSCRAFWDGFRAEQVPQTHPRRWGLQPTGPRRPG